MILYHGSHSKISRPDISYSRNDIDFGVGIYFTEDRKMATKWATKYNTSWLNTYNVDIDVNNDKIYVFIPNEEWLNYVAYNRGYTDKCSFDDSKYDIIIGPTADDKLFETLDDYFEGDLSTEQTVKIINCMHYSNQIVVKNQKYLDNKVHILDDKTKQITGKERQDYIDMFRRDSIEANKIARDIRRSIIRGGGAR